MTPDEIETMRLRLAGAVRCDERRVEEIDRLRERVAAHETQVKAGAEMIE